MARMSRPGRRSTCSARCCRSSTHAQDCGKDYRNLDRVYIPQDMLAAAGATTEALGAAYATPQLLNCLHKLTDRTQTYFDASPQLAGEIKDTRLACEVAVIDALARKLLVILKQRDPLKDKVHLRQGRNDGHHDRRRRQHASSSHRIRQRDATRLAGCAAVSMSATA